MQEETTTAIISTPIGLLRILTRAGVICSVLFEDSSTEAIIPEELSFIATHFEDYFSGKIKSFYFDIAPTGTPFQQAVWKILQEIPFGKTRSYGEIARQLGLRNGARAVGLAVGANPLLIAIPCHRVLGAKGQFTGYSGGLERKKWLLRHETEHNAFQIYG